MKFANANQKLRFVLLGGLLTIASFAHAAEIKEFFSEAPVKGEGNQFAQKSDELKSKPEDNALYHVRCWQSGTLIIDEANWRDPQLQSRFVAMKPMTGGSPGLYLVDFNHTFCEIKNADSPQIRRQNSGRTPQ